MTKSVKCKSGYHAGIKSDDIFIFQGITYGKFDQRWGKSYLTTDCQKEFSKSIVSAPQTVIEKSILYDSSLPKEKEQCLSLNVASPNLDDKLPVLVWIHGGGWLFGDKRAKRWVRRFHNHFTDHKELNVFMIGYRVGENTAPYAVEDVLCAYKKIEEEIESRGFSKKDIVMPNLQIKII